MNRFLSTLMLSACALGASAQVTKETVAIYRFTHYQAYNAGEHALSVQNAVETGFVTSKRFNVVERSQIDALLGEIKTQEALSDDKVAELGKTVGANYVILGHLASAGANSFVNDQGQTRWKATVTFQLKVVDVNTAQIKTSETITITPLFNSQTETEAVGDAMKEIKGKVDKFIATNFPTEFEIIQIISEKKGAADVIEILGGSEMGLGPKDRLEVVIVSQREIKGRVLKTSQKIGEIRVEQVTGAETSNCRVVEGGLEIKKALTENPDNIKVIYRGKNVSLFQQP